MVDVVTRINRRRYRHATLVCERATCGRRIAWTTGVRALRFATGFAETPWQWQGHRVPIRQRPDGPGAFLADVRCFHCGWQRTYRVDSLHPLPLVMS